MNQRKLRLGDSVCVRNPKRFDPACICIVGDVLRIQVRRGQRMVTFSGDVGKLGGGYAMEVAFPETELWIRLGTPISMISTQPGTPGYAEWCRISRSWGDAFIALTDQQRAEYDSMLRGYHRAKQNGTQEPRPRRRVKAKPEEVQP